MALEVLVVDDEADIRELVSGVLEDEGYTVRTAADSTQTLDAIEDRRPSMVLLDVWLQGSQARRPAAAPGNQAARPDDPGAGHLGPRQPRHRRRGGEGRGGRLHRKAVRGRAADLSGRPRDRDRAPAPRERDPSAAGRPGGPAPGQLGRDQHGSCDAEARRADRQPRADLGTAGRRQGNCRADDPSVEPARAGSVHRAVGGDDEPRSRRGGIVRRRG